MKRATHNQRAVEGQVFSWWPGKRTMKDKMGLGDAQCFIVVCFAGRVVDGENGVRWRSITGMCDLIQLGLS